MHNLRDNNGEKPIANARRHKILLIAPTVDRSDVGESFSAFQWAQHLGDKHDVTLLTYHKRNRPPASQQLCGPRIIEWPELPLIGRAERFNSIVKPGYFAFHLRARRWLRKALARGERFDLAHQPVPAAMRYPSPAAGLGIPLILGPVGGGLTTPDGFLGDEGNNPWFMKLRELDAVRWRWDRSLRGTYEEAACVFGVAPYVRERLRAVKIKRFEVITDTGLEYLPDPIDRSGRDGPVRLLYVGRLIRTKGAIDIIRALSTRPDLDAVLDIVGDGPDHAACAELIENLGMKERVVLHGWKSKAEVSAFYHTADVFIFPSYRETGGYVVVEAMAHSLPLVVADRGGPGSATTAACAIKLNITTPDALIQDLAVAIEKLCKDAGLRQEMGKAAHRHAKETALWAIKIDKVNSIYSEIIASNLRDVEDRANRTSGR